jgi:hypothetical protein
MRILTLWAALLLFVLVGCDKADDLKPFAASYKGTFIRTDGSPLGDPIVSNVTLHLSETAFTGNSDMRNYPAICSGNFTINQSKMIIANSCYFTTEFDGTFIFDGEYNYELKGNQLHIWRTYADGKTDIYKLTKAE